MERISTLRIREIINPLDSIKSLIKFFFTNKSLDTSEQFKRILAQKIRHSYARLFGKAQEVKILKATRKTFNTIIYNISIDGKPLIGKSYLFKPKEFLANEFKVLSRFQDTLFKEKFQLPEPVGYYPELGILVMSEIKGISIRELLQKSYKLFNSSNIRRIIRLCSQCLSEFHKNSHFCIKTYNGATIAFSLSYIDFDPSNIILISGVEEKLGLIDLPEQIVIDPIHRDIGTFFFGMFKARIIFPYLLRWNLNSLIELQNVFFDNYFFNAGLIKSSFDYKLARFFEYFYSKKVLQRYINSCRFLKYIYFAPLVNAYLFIIRRRFLPGFDMIKFQGLIKNLKASS